MRISDWSSDVCSSDLTLDFTFWGVRPLRTSWLIVGMNASPLNVRPSKRTVTVPRWMKLRPLTHQKWRKTADLITAKDPGGSLRSSGGSIRDSHVQALLQLKEAANRPFRSSAPLTTIPHMVTRRGSPEQQICCAGQMGRA